MQTKTSNKKRLYEVFSKVTGVQLNEQEGMSQDQWDDFRDTVEEAIKDNFKNQNSLFNDGIPQTIRDTIWDLGEIEMTLVEGDDDIQLVESREEQIAYVANYKTQINNIPLIVRLPFTVFVEKNHTGGKTDFYTKTAFTPIGFEGYSEIEVEFSK